MTIELEPGNIIDDRYEVVRSLGEGGMGTVFLAKELGLERLVAVKFLKAGLLSDADSYARFERESKILASVEHKNIVSLYRFGNWQKQYPYLVMEYLEGRSLRKCISEDSLSINDKISLIIQLCSALQKAHDLDIIHRDLKPDNIMVIAGAPLTAKVLDFGLSNFSDSKGQQLTHTGELIGSVHYMSPEQCLGRRADKRSDIYSLGCILYEVLSGAPPFECDNPIGLIHKHANEQAAPLSPMLKLPAGMNAIVTKALQKDPLQRPQSMDQFSQALHLIKDGQGHTLNDSSGGAKQATGNHKARLICLIFLALVVSSSYLVLKTRQGKSTSATDGAQRNSLKAKALKSQWSLHQNKPLMERRNTILDLVKRFESADDHSLEPLEITDLYEELHRFGKHSESLNPLENLLKIDRVKRNPGAYLRALMLNGNYLSTIGKDSQAEVHFRQALEVAKEIDDKQNEAEALKQLARAYLAQGQAKEAKKTALLANESLSQTGQLVDLSNLTIIASAQAATGELCAARQTCNQIFKSIDPQSNQVQVCIELFSSLRRHSNELAFEQMDALLQSLKTRHAKVEMIEEVLLKKSIFLIQDSNYEQALEALNKMSTLLATHNAPDATRSACLEYRGDCLLALRRFSLAKADLKTAVFLSPKDSPERLNCLARLCKIAVYEHNTTELNEWLNAMDHAGLPSSMSAEDMFRHYLALADAMAAENQFASAATVMTHCMNRSCFSNTAWQDAAEVMTAVFFSGVESKALEKARSAFERLDESRMPLHSQIRKALYVQYGSHLVLAGKTREGAKVYEAAIKHLDTDKSQQNELLLDLGCLYRHKLRDNVCAERTLTRLVSASDGLLKLQATQELGNLLVDVGKPDEALRIFATVNIPDQKKAEAMGKGFVTGWYQTMVGQARAYKAKKDPVKCAFYLRKSAPMARFLGLKTSD